MAKRQPSELEAHLGFWLRFVSNHVTQGFTEKLAARDVSVGEWVVMRHLLDRKDAAPSEIASRLNLTRGAVSKIADRLEAKGLAERTASADDRRWQALSLTARGRSLVPVLAALADENEEAFFGALDVRTRTLVMDAMRRVVEANGLSATPID